MADAKPGIFISHTGADAELANAMGELVHKVYSGGITTWYSSDQSPYGGIAPGDEWFGEVHGQLKSATRVFALVTPRSVGRPWIYWESGIGSVLCPGRVAPVVFRVDLSLPPPLGRFQAFNGLDRDSVSTNLGKVGADADLTPDLGWLSACVDEFVTKAEQLVKDVEPESEEEAANPVALLYGPLQNIVERLDRIEREVIRKPAQASSQAPVEVIPLTFGVMQAAVAGEESSLKLVRQALSSGGYSIPGITPYLMKGVTDKLWQSADVEKLLSRLHRPESSSGPWDDHEDEPTPGPWEDQ